MHKVYCVRSTKNSANLFLTSGYSGTAENFVIAIRSPIWPPLLLIAGAPRDRKRFRCLEISRYRSAGISANEGPLSVHRSLRDLCGTRDTCLKLQFGAIILSKFMRD